MDKKKVTCPAGTYFFLFSNPSTPPQVRLSGTSGLVSSGASPHISSFPWGVGGGAPSAYCRCVSAHYRILFVPEGYASIFLWTHSFYMCKISVLQPPRGFWLWVFIWSVTQASSACLMISEASLVQLVLAVRTNREIYSLFKNYVWKSISSLTFVVFVTFCLL